MSKKLTGKSSILFNFAIGALVVGDGVAALDDDSWYKVAAIASPASELPGEVGQIFKTPGSANAITPAVGDDVYPLTPTQICKGDASYSASNGTVDVTDDCDGGFNSNILDGVTDLSGSFNAFLRFKETDGDLANMPQIEILNRFFDIVEDDGAGGYIITSKTGSELIIAIMLYKENVAVGSIQVWQLIPALLTGLTTDKPFKGGQNFDTTWNKAQGLASVYRRTTNATEVVF